ncbi:RagB/SusD family nutrient uptake outer membrane protein [Arachidicoccus terrestris]|uniref:RagB/SusD family nutrient uptake outer membrane protein n=1 Tax=Arachidicoccus terrestris TaxID=2875539 RepID=UPI001CC7F730|nr:RagB/SusD family nutrient uptake outer membrane protein [Arachidicoccus terrestris]UAY56025.1 RagB/SusD family nutrient uptake outer membrane protein [Arachidicoccus terrestris]
MTTKYPYSRTICFFVTLIFLSVFCSCKKYLEKSPDKSLTIPHSVGDLRAILDNNMTMNDGYSSYGALASDDYFLTDDVYGSLSSNTTLPYYNWGLEREPTDVRTDWLNAYRRIFCSNIVLEYSEKVGLDGAKRSDLRAVMGEALFYRGLTHFQLAQVYALPYNPASASERLGVPLRLTSDFNVKATRPTLQQNYDQIIEDLESAAKFLPKVQSTLLRPNKAAVYAALSNVMLVVQDFKSAAAFSDSCLELQNKLIDYNDIDTSAAIPFPYFNTETIWYADVGYNAVLLPSKALVDSTLYRSYADNDLRKVLYFDSYNGKVAFNGYYNGGAGGNKLYGGFSVDEVYLIKAESEARLGNLSEAVSIINSLCKNRFEKRGYTAFSSSSSKEVVGFILDMRRKELCFRRMCRWIDIRRLNQLGGDKIIPKRIINGKLYELPPDNLHYAFLIPDAAIDYSDFAQNAR